MSRETTDPFPGAGEPHVLLRSLCGEWRGACRTWFEPEQLADESPIEAAISPLLEGRFVRYEYHGSLVGETMHGIMEIGYYAQRGRFEAAWIDNCHMGTGMLFSTGDALSDGFSVLGSYPDGQGGPEWGWRTEFRLLAPDRLTLTAYNITPAGQEARAVEAAYTRFL